MNEKPKGLTQADFEARRREISLSILEEAHKFLVWDVQTFNPIVSRLADELVKQLQANPRLLEPSAGVREILDEMAAMKEQGSDLAGADILGAGLFDDISRVIVDILTGEKEFIKEIIRAILKI